jgi:hypothetical protein
MPSIIGTSYHNTSISCALCMLASGAGITSLSCAPRMSGYKAISLPLMRSTYVGLWGNITPSYALYMCWVIGQYTSSHALYIYRIIMLLYIISILKLLYISLYLYTFCQSMKHLYQPGHLNTPSINFLSIPSIHLLLISKFYSALLYPMLYHLNHPILTFQHCHHDHQHYNVVKLTTHATQPLPFALLLLLCPLLTYGLWHMTIETT